MKNNRTNPDHNIWNNNGTYWCHYTVHNDNHTKQRVRVSLGTKDVAIARALRDFIMDATPRIAARIPRIPAKFVPDVRESRAVARRHDHSSAAACCSDNQTRFRHALSSASGKKASYKPVAALIPRETDAGCLI